MHGGPLGMRRSLIVALLIEHHVMCLEIHLLHQVALPHFGNLDMEPRKCKSCGDMFYTSLTDMFEIAVSDYML